MLVCPAEHGAHGAAEQVVEQESAVIEERSQQMRHGERDVLPIARAAARQSTLRGLETTITKGLGLTALTEESGMGDAAVTTYAHGTGTSGGGKFVPVAGIHGAEFTGHRRQPAYVADMPILWGATPRWGIRHYRKQPCRA